MKKILLIVWSLAIYSVNAQETRVPFWKEIQEFKRIDKETAPSQNGILLLGSESFAFWKNISTQFPHKQIINRAIPGFRFTDLNYFADDLLYPYEPKQILIYCGENDFIENSVIKPEAVVERYKTFYKTIRKRYPNVEINYFSITRAPGRSEFWPKFEEANRLIKEFMDVQKNAHFIDVNPAMSDFNGNPRKNLFLINMLQIKPNTYKIWADILKPYIK